jgi:tetratricopeptide (TPR) repeat protein
MSAYNATKEQSFLSSAVQCYEMKAKNNPSSAQNQYDLALLYAKIGNAGKGKKIMEEYLKDNRRKFEANYYTAVYYAQTGNGKQAIELLEKCSEKFSEHREECQSVIRQIRGR